MTILIVYLGHDSKELSNEFLTRSKKATKMNINKKPFGIVLNKKSSKPEVVKFTHKTSSHKIGRVVSLGGNGIKVKTTQKRLAKNRNHVPMSYSQAVSFLRKNG